MARHQHPSSSAAKNKGIGNSMDTRGMPLAVREIEALNRAFAAGDYTPDQFVHAIMGVIDRHGAKLEVVKTYPNGLKKMRILDANGEEIGTYTSA